MVSVIIVSYNTKEILANCLAALFGQDRCIDMEVFVVDNDSKDASADLVRNEFPEVRLIDNRVNVGFAAANNQAFALSRGEYIILLNPDAYVKPYSIANAVEFMEQTPECGICGGKIVSPGGKLEPSARRFPSALSKLLTLSGISGKHPLSPVLNRHEFGGFAHDRPMAVDWVPGTFTIIRRSMLDAIGFFDERYYLYYEETDLCLRAKKAGWKVYFIPSAEVMHLGGACSKTRKEMAFDDGAAQVLSFRLRSEWLYYRKNHGLSALLAAAGTELFWHWLRHAKNRLLPSATSSSKGDAAAETCRLIVKSLKDTSFGTVAPPTPW